MSTAPQPPRARWLRGWRWVGLLAFLAAVVAGAVFAAALILDGDGGTLTGPPGAEFTLEYPEGWKPFSAEELFAFQPPPLAVLRREDRDGLVVVKQDKPFAGDLRKFARDLREELDERLPDFRESAARLIRVRAGNAFYYSYVRTRRGTVNIIVIVPAGERRSFVLNAVVGGNADAAAREAVRIISSFDVEKG